MACYVNDPSMIVFDVAPPLQYVGSDGYKKDWEGYLTAFPGAWDINMSDLDVDAGGDVAYGHNVQHASFTDKDGKKMAVTVRVTDGYKKVNGQWLISHEHVSIPVDLVTMKPDLDSK
jgi:ketosteroid isomerase-like protein